MKNAQKGFSGLAVIIIVAVVILVAGVIIAGKITKKDSSDSLSADGSKPLEKLFNKKSIMKKAKESKEKVAEDAQKNGYPAVWQENNLPVYNNGLLQRVRKVGGITMVTIETDDSLEKVTEFYKEKMLALGYALKQDTTNKFISMLVFNKEGGKGKLTVQASVLRDTKKVKIQLDFVK